MQLPPLDALRCFVAVAKQASFRNAARELALTPGAVSQRVKQLEELLETRLFDRDTRSVALNQEGHALLPQAEKAIAAAAACLNVHGDVDKLPPLDITLGTRQELGMSWIVPMLPALEATLPHLTCHLYFGSGTDLTLKVRRGEIDCAVSSSRITDPIIEVFQLHQENYVMVGSPKYLKQTPLKTAADAGAHTLVDTEDGLPLFRYWRDADAKREAYHFPKILRMGSIAAIRAALLRGCGVGVLPEYFVRPDIEKKRLQVVQPQLQCLHDHFRLLFRRDNSMRFVFERLVTTMREHPLK